jgi:hypothetical protein
MNCDRCREWLSENAGRILPQAQPGCDEVRLHLFWCADCRVEAEAYRDLPARLRAAAPRPEPPADFWRRASAAMDRAEPRSPFRIRTLAPGWTAGLAAALTVSLSFAAYVAQSGRAPAMKNPVAVYSEACDPGGALDLPTNDPERASRWINERSRLTMPIVNLKLARATLIGAKIVNQPEGEIPALAFLTPEGEAILMLSRDSGLPAGQWSPVQDGRYRYNVSHYGSVRMSTWAIGESRYTLAYPGSFPRLLELSRAAARHCDTVNEPFH